MAGTAGDDQVAAIHTGKQAVGQVAVGIRLQVVPQRGPAAEVVPVETALGDADVLRFFHHRVIDGNTGLLHKTLRQLRFQRIAPLHLQNIPEKPGQLRRIPLERLHQRTDLPDEHPAVPAVASRRQKTFRRRRIRLLLEAKPPEETGPGAGFQRPPAVNVTVAGSRFRRIDADGEQPAGPGRGQFRRVLQHRAQLPGLFDRVVGGQRQHHRIRPAPRGDQRGRQRDARTGIAGSRLPDDVLRRHLRQYGTDLPGIIAVGDNQNPLRRHQRLKPGCRHLQHRPVPQQLLQLFRPRIAAPRPETFTAAAGHDNGIDIVVHN